MSETREQREERFFLDQAVLGIANTVAPIFRMFGWTWQNERHPPNNEQIAENIARKAAQMDECRSINSGRIFMVRDEGSSEIDVYVHVGVIEDKEASWDNNLW